MLEFLRALKREGAALRRVPPLIGAAAVAELFYKFHSFILELGAFLGTWLVFDVVFELVRPRTDVSRLALPVDDKLPRPVSTCQHLPTGQGAPIGPPPIAEASGRRTRPP